MFLHVLIGRHVLIGMKSAFITTSYSKGLNLRTSQLVVRDADDIYENRKDGITV